MTLLIAIIGWLGAVLVLAAYGLLSAGRLEASSNWYHLLNIGGAACLVVNTYWNGALPSTAVNVIWTGLGAYAMLRRPRAPLGR